MTTPVSLTLPQFDRTSRPFLDLCRQTLQLGLAGVFAFDHLIPIGDPRRPILEAATVLGAAAATVPAPGRVGALVLRTSVRPPEVTAAVASTLAAIAGDRVVIGLGVGDRHSAEEGRRFGLPRQRLSERLHTLELTVELIRLKAPQVRIWVGGLHPSLRQAAVRLADGWNAWGVDPSDLAGMVHGVREAATRPAVVSWGGGVILAPDQKTLDEAIARRGGRTAVTGDGLIAGTPGEVIAELAVRAELVDELVVSVLPNVAENWRLFASAVLPELVR